MRLFLLREIEIDRYPHDKAHGFVIRAEHNWMARRMAADQAGDEGPEFWLNVNKSSCKRLTKDGPIEVVLRDHLNG